MIDTSSYIDMSLLVILLCIGKIIKSSVLCEKIPNKYIVLIIPIMGAIIEVLCKQAISLDIITSGLCTGLSATGVHQFGTQLFISEKEESESEEGVDNNE